MDNHEGMHHRATCAKSAPPPPPKGLMMVLFEAQALLLDWTSTGLRRERIGSPGARGRACVMEGGGETYAGSTCAGERSNVWEENGEEWAM